MTRLSDYLREVSHTRLSDHEVESLLAGASTGSDALADLEAFVAALSTDTGPSRDTYHMATTLAAISRATARPVRRGFRRLATLAATSAMFLSMAGVALAADGSVPGDPLYRLDRALESIGVGDGGFEERVVEYNVLLDRGHEEQAFEFLAEVIAESGESDASARAPDDRTVESDPGSIEPGDTTRNPNSDVRDDPPAQDVSEDPDSEAPSQNGSEDPGTGTTPASQDDQNSNSSSSNGQGEAVGKDSETLPPGQEKADGSAAEPDPAGPKDDKDTSPSNQGNGNSQDDGDQGNDDPGSNGNGQGSQDNQGSDPGENSGNG